jgi:hypothetical protein
MNQGPVPLKTGKNRIAVRPFFILHTFWNIIFYLTTPLVIRSGELDEMAETALWGLAKIFCLRNEIEEGKIDDCE